MAHEGADPQHAAVARDRQAPQVSSFRDDGAAALEWAASYLERVRELPVLARVEPGAIRAALPARPPETAEPFADVLRDLDDVLLPGLTHWQSPRYFAYFPSTGSEPGILAELLAATLNQVGILWRTSPALQELEEVALAWLAELLGLPPGLHGHIEDSASSGLVTALAAARAAAPGRRVVVCSEHTHSSTAKAARLLELELRAVPVDETGAIRAGGIDLTDACAVVATIGTTSTTAIDPVAALADLCGDAGCWLHVDAAYAGSAAVCPELRHLFAGWERADSIGVNPHKWLLTPMDCSAFFTSRRMRSEGVQPRARVPPRQRGRRQPERVRRAARRRSRPQALGRAPLLRPRRATGGDPRARPPRALVESWVEAEPGWEVCAPPVLARLLPARRLRRGQRGVARARERNRRSLHVAHACRRPLRPSSRSRQARTTRRRPHA